MHVQNVLVAAILTRYLHQLWCGVLCLCVPACLLWDGSPFGIHSPMPRCVIKAVSYLCAVYAMSKTLHAHCSWKLLRKLSLWSAMNTRVTQARALCCLPATSLPLYDLEKCCRLWGLAISRWGKLTKGFMTDQDWLTKQYHSTTMNVSESNQRAFILSSKLSFPGIIWVLRVRCMCRGWAIHSCIAAALLQWVVSSSVINAVFVPQSLRSPCVTTLTVPMADATVFHEHMITYDTVLHVNGQGALNMRYVSDCVKQW